ncbi:hypothetical protein LTR93_011119 [Exophiala xenobiotica]|nr:hypothetical protein LTR93_011119 [Exophiala xenobiotica]
MNFDRGEGLELGGTKPNVDSNVVAELPDGCRILSTEGHGVSFWANTARIDVVIADGQTRNSFFVKVVSNDIAKNMVYGEFGSMKAIYSLLPDFVPKPIAWGTYRSNPDIHFFLCEYREMADNMPDPKKFSAQLALLHKNSQSPTGKFGFHITTCSGNLPQLNDWEDKWETFLRRACAGY